MTKRTNLMQERKPGGHGGKRPGAGHPPGTSIFARTANLIGPNAMGDVRQRHRHLIAEIQGSSRDPLLVLIDIATDRRKPDPLRVEAAAVAVRYVHPALSATQVSMHHVQADQTTVMQMLTERLDRLAPVQPVIDAVALPPDPKQARPRLQKAAETGLASDRASPPGDPGAPVAPRQVLERARRRPQKAAETGPASDQALDPSDPDAPVAPWQELAEACAG